MMIKKKIAMSTAAYKKNFEIWGQLNLIGDRNKAPKNRMNISRKKA
jgi:hypothetical protein